MLNKVINGSTALYSSLVTHINAAHYTQVDRANARARQGENPRFRYASRH
jgi:hypothetical protein